MNKSKKTSGFKIKGSCKIIRYQIFAFLTVFCCLSQAFAEDVRRNPIDVNLIIDSSSSFANVKEGITAWISEHLDHVLEDGDTVTVWNAGVSAAVIFTGSINGSSDREELWRCIGDLTASGDRADFTAALTAVDTKIKNAEQGSIFNYTLLISASQTALISLLSGPQANLLRFSRVEEFPGWRAIVVGLNLDTRVRRAAANYINAQ
ncbi:MAG: hypothetical protein FWC03_11990 [Treponema sp.]|nr:hypothetical protein [Treponema sp.]